MKKIISIVWFFAFVGGCASTADEPAAVDAQADEACDLLLSTFQTCFNIGKSEKDAAVCETYSAEVRGLYLELLTPDSDTADFAGEHCQDVCLDGVAGGKVPELADVCM